MKLKYLGTAAAEGIPALFCQCGICQYASKAGGRNIRGRSCALINGHIMIDFTPDMFFNKVKYNLDLAAVSHIFFTHSHIDHLAAKELCYYHEMYSIRNDMTTKLHVYGNEKVLDVINADFKFDMGHMPGCVVPHALLPFESVTAGSLCVTALPARHDLMENCYIFLIEEDGKRFLYANDTTIPPDETFEYLKGKTLDAVSLDCTIGKLSGSTAHMGFSENLTVKERLIKQGSVHESTSFISHHFSHNGRVNYDDFDQLAQGAGFISSYDGMEITIGG